MTDVYACAVLLDGGAEFEVLSVADVEAIRRRSRAATDGPWVTDWEAMARKTAVRQLAKWLPMATVLTRAIAAEGSVRTELDPDVLDTLDAELVDEPPTTDEQHDTAPAQDGAEDTSPSGQEADT